MKPNYDNLTPAQKAKFTRLSNKLDEQRTAAYQIQWEAYRKKSNELHAEIDPQVKQIQEQTREKIEVLRTQIRQLIQESEEQVSELRQDIREKCAPEWLAYEQASNLASKWRAEKWVEVRDNFWKELGYDLTEEGKKTA
jgi:seryl-tRNA synthetase